MTLHFITSMKMQSVALKYFSLVFTLCVSLSQMSVANAAPLCMQLFESAQKAIKDPEQKAGANTLHQINPKLHTTDPVEQLAAQYKKATGITLTKPADKIINWLNYLESSYSKNNTHPAAKNQIKNYYHKLYLTKKSEVPEGFYDLQVRIAREQGHGNITMTQTEKKRLADIALNDQKKSLDAWLDYLLSEDSKFYPMWIKYWAFNSMAKLGKYDIETGTFGHRTKGQMSQFPELNQEAFAKVVDAVAKKANAQSLASIQDPIFSNLLQGMNFGKLYGRRLQLAGQKNTSNTANGIWKVYKQGSDHVPLVKSLEGHNTGWCTAGEKTAKAQLEGGDFHVYYSRDLNGRATIPRIAIRMDGEEIGEIRGVGKDQNLDGPIADSPVLKNKLTEFGSKGELYTKKTEHMKQLTQIENATKQGQDLTSSQIKFLYEVDEHIIGFGHEDDPRIEEIRSQRDVRKDLSVAFNVDPSKVSLTQEEFLKGNTDLHYGDINLNIIPNGFIFPKIFVGILDLDSLRSAYGLVLPEIMSGVLNLNGIRSAEGLTLPKQFSGNLNLANLETAEHFVLPKQFNGNLNLYKLHSAEGLVLPKVINGDLILRSLRSANGLVLPKVVNGELDLNGLRSAKGLVFPEIVNGYIDLRSLQSPEELVLPKEVNGDLDLRVLQAADNVVFPKIMNGDINLERVRSAKGATFPEVLKGEINFYELKSTEGLIFSKNIKRSQITLPER